MTDIKAIYQIKVTLVGSKPPIWRRILIAGTTTLSQLHNILQITMGWSNSHLHLFKVGEQIYSDQEYDEDIEYGTKSEKRYRLEQIAPEGGFRFRYEYDFGDSWEHALLVEKILPAEKGKRYPVCLAGKRACPPEDVGGIWGYEELLGAIADPGNKENRELLDWIGGKFNPEAFDMNKVNESLSHLKRARLREAGEATEPISARIRAKYEDRVIAWAQNLTQEQTDGFISLALLHDMQTFIDYLLENRTVGTQSTGNLPLKAVRAICSRFVVPPALDETIGEHIYKLRSEDDVRLLFYIHILAEVSGLVTVGSGRVWKVTEEGEKYSQLLPSIQTLLLLDRWWNLADWTMGFPFSGFKAGLPIDFGQITLSCLLNMPAGKTNPYDVFADDLIKQSGLIWPIENQVSARDILHSAIERMVINPLVGFGVLECSYSTKIIGSSGFKKIATIRLTPIGKEMLELVE